MTPITQGTTTDFGLLRHGQTVWNREKRIQGRGDSPLTRTGIDQIRNWASFLHGQDYARILCSDLGRVRETVSVLNRTLQLPVTFDSRLREQNWGKWEGMTVQNVQLRFQDELDTQIRAGWHFRPPGGESRNEVKKRIYTALESAHTQFGGEKILVVCHLGIIKCLLYSLENRKFLPDEPKLLKKFAMHEVSRDRSGFHTVRLNIEAETA